ncbi:DUF3422 family protein [Rhizobium sp. BR 362]
MCLLLEHPLREELHNELHARPSLYFEGDVDVWHVAVIGEDGPPALRMILRGWRKCRRHNRESMASAASAAAA